MFTHLLSSFSFVVYKNTTLGTAATFVNRAKVDLDLTQSYDMASNYLEYSCMKSYGPHL